MFHKKYSVYAVYRLEDTSKPKDLPFEEVAFGSGTQWEKRITRDSKVNLEDIIWDSHAEVIANQSFRRYLISQMKNLISGTKESIFEYDRSSSSSTNTVPSSPLPCLKLRSNFRIHLYISKVPCGGAAHCLRSATDGTPISTEGTPISTEGTPNSTDGTPIWGKKEGCVMEQEHSVRYVIKSCTDKIASWIKCGVQGTALYPYIGRIQIDTITIFSENRFPRQYEDACAELLKYANSDTKTIIIFTSQNRNAQLSQRRISELPGHRFLSINWWKEDEENIHVIDTRRINNLQHDPSRICMSKMCEALYDCLGLNTTIDTSRHDNSNGLVDILRDFDKLEIVSANQSQTHIQI